MAKVRVPLNNFQFGEVSPSLTSRTDTQVYNNSAEQIRNFFIRSEGGLLKRAGTQRLANLGNYTNGTCTITVTDYANIVVGSTIKLPFNDGTIITLQWETSSGDAPSAASGNTHFVRANESNNTTADNIFTALNAVDGFTVTNPAANVVTVKRDDGGSDNLEVVSSDTTRLAVTNFSVLRQEVRLEPFIFSDDEKYIIAFSNTQIQIFQINASTGAVSSIQTLTSQSWLVNTTDDPYLEELTFAQQGDLMFICHPTFQTRILERTSLTTFAVSTFSFDTSRDGNDIHQPYFSFQSLGTTITANGTTGSGKTLTTSSDYWVSGHVGTDVLIGKTRCRITGYTSATVVTATINGTLHQQLPIDSIKVFEGSGTVQVTHALHGLAVSASITVERCGAVGGIAQGNLNGSRTITAVIDENTYEFTAGSSASATSSAIGGGSPRIVTAAATTEWAEQSYSDIRGYPAAVTFHQNRLWFGGTLSQPDGIWGSRSGEYFNFDVGDAEDNDALDLTANVGEIFSIRHLVSNRDLQIFTTGAELFIPTISNKAVTPANAQIRRQTPYGASFVRPTVFDGATLFVQKTGTALREFLFTDTEAAYTAVAISSLAPHLILNPVQQTSIKGALGRSESYAFLINKDGTLAVFYSVRGEQKAGWTLWDTQGVWHSICAVHDRLFAVSARDDGSGTTKLYLEEFLNTMPMDFCDSFSGSASVFTGLTSAHFTNNAVVKATNGNDFLGSFTVSGGQIDASSVKTGITQAFIGYAFTPTIKTLPIDVSIAGGPITGEPRQIPKVILDLNETLAVSVQGPSTTSTSRDMVIRNVTDDMSLDRIPVTGKEEFRMIGYSRDPRVIVSQSFPLNLQINGMVVEVAF